MARAPTLNMSRFRPQFSPRAGYAATWQRVHNVRSGYFALCPISYFVPYSSTLKSTTQASGNFKPFVGSRGGGKGGGGARTGTTKKEFELSTANHEDAPARTIIQHTVSQERSHPNVAFIPPKTLNDGNPTQPRPSKWNRYLRS